MAVSGYVGARTSGEWVTIQREGDLHSRKIWRLSDVKKSQNFIYVLKAKKTKTKTE